MKPLTTKEEKKVLFYSAIIPISFICCLWLIKILEMALDIHFNHLGVLPRNASGIPGILLSPLIHADFGHLMSNSIPLLVLGTGTIYFYRSLSYRVFIFVWLVGGLCLWLGGRANYHIGASGLVYGMASFLFFSGAIRRDPRLAALSLIVVFLYGGLIWGIFPLWPNISWEGHLFGGLTGFSCAIMFRKEGPQRKVYSWELEEDAALEDSSDFENHLEPSQFQEE